ncbi:MAG: DUF4342 domain-containing protein [Anaerovoracaceae bacterium]
MEITLEKIELVKDRTGVTYKEAKEALEAAEGNVVDAIIAIEETIDIKTSKKASEKCDDLVRKMKEIVKKGNISRIVITKDDETLVNLPLTVGILGTFVAFWGVIAGIVASFGFKCQIHFIKDDGSVIDLTEKAGVFYEEAKDKGAEVYEDIKEKAPEVYDDIKDKSTKTFNTLKEMAKDKLNDLKKDDDRYEDEFCEDCHEDCSECVCDEDQCDKPARGEDKDEEK